jgi:branched-chain amino acid transport system ATP-binding protein
VLTLDRVDAGYGPFRALFDVSLTIHEGGALALLGPNGAGKTTIARVCSGLVTPTEGRVIFDGEEVTGASAHQLARLGVAHAVEGRSVFSTLTVEENLALSFRQEFGGRAVRDHLDRAYELFPRLGERRRQVAGTLSGGEQRMLSLARVMVLGPRLLIADELSLGLAPVLVADVYATLQRIKANGTSLLVIEQQVDHALELADEAMVLNHGEIVFHGPATESAEIARHVLPGGNGRAAGRNDNVPTPNRTAD